jgi:hypothetical protein
MHGLYRCISTPTKVTVTLATGVPHLEGLGFQPLAFAAPCRVPSLRNYRKASTCAGQPFLRSPVHYSSYFLPLACLHVLKPSCSPSI